MATNPYFRNYGNFNEQNLIDDLVIESIKMYGVDIAYIPRNFDSIDNILNEDDTSTFGGDLTTQGGNNYSIVYDMEMYVKSVDGFEGEGDFLSRFGLQIRDQVTFSVAYRTFERFATRLDPDQTRPNEGDVIYFPLNDKMFKVMFVEHESVFYQHGALQVYDLRCELFEYSGERFQTGRYEIDHHFDDVDITQATTLTQLANTDPIAKNVYFEAEADSVLDFSEIDPFSENISIPD
ncbi:hypothetical protein OAA24_00690 [bacterium]|jgi:hypothetical protein|nr:hypothetical protein [bacterium]